LPSNGADHGRRLPQALSTSDDTAAHTGRFGEIVALEDSVIASLTAQDWTGNALTAIPLKASTEIEGVFTSITLTSGTVVAYRI
jgi:hypothetical protein